MLRRLRIAVSVVSGICCMLLIVLWVRSYWVLDVLHIPKPREMIVNSTAGAIQVSSVSPLFPSGWPMGWVWKSFPSEATSVHLLNSPRWQFFSDTTNFAVRFPHWLTVVMLATFAAAPWLPNRFSLRTLLLTTTAIAILLSLAIYTTRG